jgi:hypothetical protein
MIISVESAFPGKQHQSNKFNAQVIFLLQDQYNITRNISIIRPILLPQGINTPGHYHYTSGQ